MTPSDVSVVIPALNEAERIAAAVESAWSNGAGQVIVCDGGSDDQTVAAAERNRATVVHSGRGRGRQLSHGAKAATGDVLVFLHADNRLNAGSLNELCRCARLAAVEAGFWGGFRQRIDAPQMRYRLLERGNALRIRYRGIPFGDQAMFVTRPLYDHVGGFTDIPLMEDVVLSKSLRKIRWPSLINGIVHVDARRWKKRGVLRQTLLNWGLQFAHGMGVSETRLSNWYR